MKSPLRYPGGKTRAIGILSRYLETEYPTRTILLSPFLGGGSFELDRASKEYTVFANDLFVPLFKFWNVLKSNPEELHRRITESVPVSKEMFLSMRKNILDIEDDIEVAKAYFLVNRCSFSGATFCGGFSQEASEKRCNASAINKLKDIDMKRVTLSNLDAIEFLTSHPETNDTVVYADPPYFITTYIYGKDGDMHETFNHEAFATYIKTRRDWVLCYNDCPYIRELYKDCRILSEKWSYGMNANKSSSEIIILPPKREEDS